MKILVLGASGTLGHMALRVLGRDHEVWGTCRGPYGEISGLRHLIPRARCREGIGIRDWEELRAAIRAVSPTLVVNAIGITKQSPDARDVAALIEVNALFPHRVGELATEIGAKLIQISTDCVYSGSRGAYRPCDVPDPADDYGRTKLLGEVGTPHLTLRTSFIGRQLRGNTGLLEWFLSQRGRTVKGFVGARFSGVTTLALAELLGQLATGHSELSGLYHVASEPISKYDLLSRINELLDLAITVQPDTSVSCDRSLDGTAFRSATGLGIPGWDEMLSGLAKDWRRYETWRTAA